MTLMTRNGAYKGIIDVHTHPMLQSWLSTLPKTSADGRPLIEGFASAPQWSAEMAIEVMDQNGIDAMVLSNPAGTRNLESAKAASLARSMNDEMAEILARYPKRFGAFAVVPLQDIDVALAEMDYALDKLGFDGICLQTNFHGAYPGHPRFEPIFAELNRRRSVAFVHPVTPDYAGQLDLPFIPGLLEFMIDSTRAVTNLIYSGTRQRYPDFTYIATHGGGAAPFLAHRIGLVASTIGTGYGGTMSYDDVLAGLKSIHFDLTLAVTPGSLASLLQLVPPTQLLSGFDYPLVPSRSIALESATLVEGGLLSDDDLRAIARENALRILPALSHRLRI